MNTLQELESTLKIKFQNQLLLKEALTHRSFLNEHPEIPNSNERLEFLGDSVLSIIVSTELFKRFHDYPEGKLTSLRSSLVRAKMLCVLAEQISLGNYMLLSKGEEKGGGRSNPALLADTFEAVLGAIFLDQGLSCAEGFLRWILFPRIDELNSQLGKLDFKSSLQEFIQEKHHFSPSYRVLEEIGPDHAKEFVVGVYMNDVELAKGKGKSKQEAEQEAARLALEKENKIR